MQNGQNGSRTSAPHCSVCKKGEAKWVMRIDGGPRQAVHKPCGKHIAEMAPDGVKVKIFPSEELRREWDARNFWAEKFREAEKKRDSVKPAPATGQPPSG